MSIECANAIARILAATITLHLSVCVMRVFVRCSMCVYV